MRRATNVERRRTPGSQREDVWESEEKQKEADLCERDVALHVRHLNTLSVADGDKTED